MPPEWSATTVAFSERCASLPPYSLSLALVTSMHLEMKMTARLPTK
jgi:hypothetical protein